MFLSLVRPDRISSPITSSAAVTTWWGVDEFCGAGEFADVMTTWLLSARGSGSPLPCHCGLGCIKSPPEPFGSRPGESSGEDAQMSGPAPLRPIAYARPRIICEKASDGSLRCRSAEALAPYDPNLAHLFRA